ncbi:MAG: acetolactate synthase-1/3 small subunit [Gammaproteobacteria bacterium]|jgi:acetolactate synthase-1/3 small subunit
MIRRVISLLLENEPGALSRVAGLFFARAYNIESLSVAPTEDPTVSRMTLVTSGEDEDVIEQITKQLNKLLDVIKLADLTEGKHVERELMLIKVRASAAQRDEVHRLVEVFRAHVVDVSPMTYIVELTGTGEKLDAFVAALDPKTILEVARSGAMGVSRGEKSLRI